MEPRRLTALLLRARPLAESDLMLDFYSHELGRLTAIAKGAKRSKKRFSGLLESGHWLAIAAEPGRKGDLWLLTGARLINPHLGLRQDWRRLIMAGPVLELLLRATATHDPQPAALALALFSLSRLELATAPAELAAALLVFLTRLLTELGFGLSLGACVRCGRPHAAMAEPCLSLEGGLVCAVCPPGPEGRLAGPAGGSGRGGRPAPAGLLGFMRAAQNLEPAALGRLRLSPALARPGLAYLADFWRHVCAHDLPSLGLALDAPGPGQESEEFSKPPSPSPLPRMRGRG
ncbi:MAG: DNA repair protein RecO [Thermodesulfobacteriota bacterium]